MQPKLAYKTPFHKKTSLRLFRLHKQPLCRARQSGMLKLCTAATHVQSLHGTVDSCLFMLYMHRHHEREEQLNSSSYLSKPLLWVQIHHLQKLVCGGSLSQLHPSPQDILPVPANNAIASCPTATLLQTLLCLTLSWYVNLLRPA